MWYNDENVQKAARGNKNVSIEKVKTEPDAKIDNKSTSNKPISPPLPECTKLDLSKLETSTVIHGKRSEKPFFVDDDRRSKITVVSMKSDRTSRTVQTLPSVIEPPKPRRKGAKGVLITATQTVRAGFRESSIKRIIGSGLTIATFLMLLCGVFLPFWNVYTYTVNDESTGYYGGLWSYCLHTASSGSTDCHTFTESTNAHWFRAVRFLELMAFLGIIGLLGLIIAYMFFLRLRKYSYLQWIIVALCFGIGVFVLLGLIVYAACYPNSSHISSAYGLTCSAVFGCAISGSLFLWDKIQMDKKGEMSAATKTPRTSRSGARSVRSLAHSRRSRAASQRSHPASHISSHAPSTRLAVPRTRNTLPKTPEQKASPKNI